MDSISFAEFTEICKQLEKTSSKKQKVTIISNFLKKASKNEVAIIARFLSGTIFPVNSNLVLDVGGATIYKVIKSLPSQTLFQSMSKPKIVEIYKQLEKLAKTKGEGSRKRKEIILKGIFLPLTNEEREYLIRAIFGEMRTGASEGIILEAIAQATDTDLEKIRRAYMFIGDIGEVAEIALTQGKKGIEETTLQLFRPVRPMLAEMAYSIDEALRAHKGKTGLEFKYDGIRVQIHIQNNKVKVYTRRLNEITEHVPDLVEKVKWGIRRVNNVVLDAEALALVNGKPVPFQMLVRRVQRQRDIYKYLKNLPFDLYVFDILYLNDRLLVDLPYIERWKELENIVESKLLATRTIVDNVDEGEKFYKMSISSGHEGVMAKKLDGKYMPGSRKKLWLKIKEADTIDCVIIAAEWGHGRRRGWLSDYYLGVIDEESGEYVCVGKTFKGLTDAEFEQMTKKLLELKISEKGYVVIVQPKIVVEVAYSEIQKSPKYKSGYALRFARITRIRWDKDPRDVSTLKEVSERFKKQFEKKARLEDLGL